MRLRFVFYALLLAPIGSLVAAGSLSELAGRTDRSLSGVTIRSTATGIEANRLVEGRRQTLLSIQSTSSSSSEGLRGRRVPDSIRGHIEEASRLHGVDPNLVAAVIARESAFRTEAVSPVGAQGLMQLMPATARELGVRDAFDPRENVMGGTRYLRWLLDRYDGNVDLALAGYNAGPGAVQRHGGIPPYRETRAYVVAVRQELRNALMR